jgi:YggT family protein
VAGVAYIIELALRAYIFLIFAWVLGSWLPNLRYQQWYRWVSSVVEPYIELFRPLRLQYGGVDLTPMAAVFAIYLFRMLLLAVVARGGY